MFLSNQGLRAEGFRVAGLTVRGSSSAFHWFLVLLVVFPTVALLHWSSLVVSVRLWDVSTGGLRVPWLLLEHGSFRFLGPSSLPLWLSVKKGRTTLAA